MNPELALRTAGFTFIAGVDEAGRGAYAGPIVIAAVILDPAQPLDEVGDSKSFSEEERTRIAQQIKERALSYAIISIDAAEIDTHGLQPSNIGGMRRAITALSVKPDYVITDGYRVEGLEIPSLAMWRGDDGARHRLLDAPVLDVDYPVHDDGLAPRALQSRPAGGELIGNAGIGHVGFR